ncbi:type II toxin-antitoxin system RelE/ParE family toxin [Longimicrobium sp.]|jgi:mRNA-degrading endonuclease RelE of RelBE toxin-antitoxin system|uniref:type II toxin-antitoxin system RelE/ParE family toxin n=1 Tax=Longimicrobium sp. TaxID=2029185 RepID=UPI002EDBA083
MEIVETPLFTRHVEELLSPESYRDLQIVLLDDPTVGPVIPRTGGIRKVRWAGSGRGKRGGVRVIYYFAVARDRLLMLYVYPKNQQDDLTEAQRRALRAIVEAEYG